MTTAHQCPICGERRKAACLYVCKPCKHLLDQEVGLGWEHTDWWKAIQSSHDRLMRTEELERTIIAKLNEGGSVVAPRTLFERAVELIRAGTLDEGELMVYLSAGKKRVNRGHLRKVVTRALTYTADELHLITATSDETEDEYGLLTA